MAFSSESAEQWGRQAERMVPCLPAPRAGCEDPPLPAHGSENRVARLLSMSGRPRMI